MTARQSVRALLLATLVLLPIWAVYSPGVAVAKCGDAPCGIPRSYWVAQLTESGMSMLNPDTLASTKADLWLGGYFSTRSPQIFVSDNTKRIALVYYKYPGAVTRARQVTIHILDAVKGAQLAQFHPQAPAFISGFNQDGTQLYAYAPGANGQGSSGMMVLDAQTGRVLSRMSLSSTWDQSVQLDTAHGRAYILNIFPIDSKTNAMQSPRLESYDLASGRTVASVTLDGVVAGYGQSTKTEGTSNIPVFEQWMPGFALSPDGSRVAVLDGSSDTLRLIDTSTMKIVQTETLHQPQSLLDRFGSWLGVLPVTAEAKEVEGKNFTMHFSPDGRSLYVTGWGGQFDKSGTFSWQTISLRRIDVATGTIAAQLPDNTPSWWSAMAPDGSAYYTLVPSEQSGAQEDCPCTLERLDPQTLQITAQRVFPADPVTDSSPTFYLLASY